jgi:hypothetical protein
MAQKLIAGSPTADDREQMGEFLKEAFRLDPDAFDEFLDALDKVQQSRVRPAPH